MVDEKLSFLRSLGFDIEEIEITGSGLIRYKNRRKHTRLKTRKNFLRRSRIQNRTLIYLVKLHDFFCIRKKIRPCKVDTPLLVDIIIRIFRCSKRTAYDYAYALIYVDENYP